VVINRLISRLESATTPDMKDTRTKLRNAVRTALAANPEAVRSFVQAASQNDASISADLRDSRKRPVATIKRRM
jgi:hypothetical protein